MAVHAEQAFTHRRPVFLAQLGFLARVDGHHLVFCEPFLILQKSGHQRRHRGVFTHHQHLGVAAGVKAHKVGFQLAQFFQACTQHHPLAFAQGGVARLVALGLELQRQRTNLLAPVQHQRLDQACTHRALQVKVGHDVREVHLAFVLACAHIVVRCGREVHLHKAPPFGGGDAAQAFLPFHLGGLALALELVDVVRFVVEHHQLGQPGQKLQHIAARITTVQHVQAVAGSAAWCERQHGVDHLLRFWRCAGRAHGIRVLHIVRPIALGQQVPVADGDHAVAGGFQANLAPAAHVAAHKGKHRVTVRFGDEQVGKLRHI